MPTNQQRLAAIESRLQDIRFMQGWMMVALSRLILKGNKLMASFDDVVVEIGETEGKVDELLALVQSLRDQVASAGVDPVKLAAVLERFDAIQAKMTAAGATPAPEPTPEPTTGGEAADAEVAAAAKLQRDAYKY